jgi:hypothetical protein
LEGGQNVNNVEVAMSDWDCDEPLIGFNRIKQIFGRHIREDQKEKVDAA